MMTEVGALDLDDGEAKGLREGDSFEREGDSHQPARTLALCIMRRTRTMKMMPLVVLLLVYQLQSQAAPSQSTAPAQAARVPTFRSDGGCTGWEGFLGTADDVLPGVSWRPRSGRLRTRSGWPPSERGTVPAPGSPVLGCDASMDARTDKRSDAGRRPCVSLELASCREAWSVDDTGAPQRAAAFALLRRDVWLRAVPWNGHGSRIFWRGVCQDGFCLVRQDGVQPYDRFPFGQDGKFFERPPARADAAHHVERHDRGDARAREGQGDPSGQASTRAGNKTNQPRAPKINKMRGKTVEYPRPTMLFSDEVRPE